MSLSDRLQQSNLGSLLGVMWNQPISIHRTPANPINTDISTSQTVSIIKQLAIASSKSAIVLSALHSATNNLSVGTTKQRVIARAIFYWIKSHVRFTEDEVLIWQGLGIDRLDKELLIPPITLLNMKEPMGDCDDFSLLGASLLLAGGIPCSLITIAADTEDPEKFSHIYLKAYYMDEPQDTREQILDISHGSYPGWEYKAYTRKAEWYIV